jgi:hypothetical protein
MIPSRFLQHFAIPLLFAACPVGAVGGETAAEAPVASAADTLTFSLEQRLRGEWRENNFDFDDSTDALTDDVWLLSRTRLAFDWSPVSWLTLFAQGQDTREFFSDRPNRLGILGAEGDDSFDLREGYVEIGDPTRHLSLRAGRQLLVYGDKRLISSGEWGNTSRTFDAFRFHYATSDWWLDAFASSVVNFRDGDFNLSDWLAENDSLNQTFSGLYFSTSACDWQVMDFYVLHLRDDDGTSFATYGTRIKGDPAKLSGWEYAAEMAVQSGDLKNQELSAFAGHWDIGYNWLHVPWKPRLALEYSFATGDSDSTDGSVGTFQNLFPTNHLYYGYMDLFAWQNIHNPALHFSVQPHERLRLQLDYHAFWLADSGDAWYRASITNTARPISPGASRFAGTELDLTASWKAHEHLEVQAGYSHFFGGDYLRDTGAGDDADFAYLMVTLSY